MRIRSAGPEDAAAIYAVHETNGETEEWDHDVGVCRAQLADMARLSAAASIVAEEEGRIVAEMKVWWEEDVPALGTSLDVSTLYVRRERQRRGVGGRLLDWAVTTAQQRGCRVVTVRPNQDSAPFYLAHGFADALVRRRYVLTPLTDGGIVPAAMAPVRLADLEPPPGRQLQTQRSLHPCQWWHGLVLQEAQECLVVDGQALPVILACRCDGALAALRRTYWRDDATAAELFLWTAGPSPELVRRCLRWAAEQGLESVEALVHGEMEGTCPAAGGEPQGDGERILTRPAS